MIDQSMQFAAPSYRQPATQWPSWLSFLGGSLLTFGMFYFGVARPTSDELSSLRRQIETMEQSVAMVAGHKGSVDETNHLLNLLGQQQAYAISARKAIAEIQKLNTELIGESLRAEEALLAVDQLASIKDLAIANSDRMAEATDALNASGELQQRLAESSGTTEEALRAGLDLLAIQGELSRNAERNESAQATLETLVDIRSALEGESAGIEVAGDRISELLSLKNAVLEGTSDIKDSIETLTLTRELHDQYRDAARSFGEMRSWMMEMSTMLPLFNKVQTALQPLTDLANLERMQPQQLREFARVFTQQSKTRLASVPNAVAPDNASGTSSADSVNKVE